ncbi:MAG: DnaA/Hda family protein [Pseudomonadota bacterium]
MSQIALPFESRSQGDPTRLVVGNANAHVVEALGDPSHWPFRTAVLTGPQRSGKTLLGRWAEGQGILVIDEADSQHETELFHRWNAAQESGTPLLLIADTQPWEIKLPDLRSRLGGSLQLEIGEPDDDMAGQLIEAIAAQRSLSLAAGAADYLVPRTTRSFAALERLVIAIDRISLERQVPATMSVWRDALEATLGPEQQSLL